MKTNFKSLRGNNVQKTILRFAAVVISFILISFTVSAHDFWKRLITGSSFNEIALAMANHSKKVNNSTDFANESFDFILNQEKDEPLSLEPWMMEENFHSKATPVIVNETDIHLQLEPWMLNEKLFESRNVEKDLKLESWMVNDSIWK